MLHLISIYPLLPEYAYQIVRFLFSILMSLIVGGLWLWIGHKRGWLYRKDSNELRDL